MDLVQFRFRRAIAPQLLLRDSESGVAFYRQAFAAERPYRLDDSEGRLVRAELEFGDDLLLVEALDAAGARPVGGTALAAIRIRLMVPSADETLGEAVSLGAELLAPPTNGLGLRSGVVRDPFGVEWVVASPLSLKP